MRENTNCWLVVALLAVIAAACGGGMPGEDGLRDSFVAQLAASGAVSDLQRAGDEITFTGPAADGGTGPWRVRLDESRVEPNDDPSLPYKGTIVSSWFSNGQLVQPSGGQSNLPAAYLSAGLAQECWALWNSATAQWEW